MYKKISIITLHRKRIKQIFQIILKTLEISLTYVPVGNILCGFSWTNKLIISNTEVCFYSIQEQIIFGSEQIIFGGTWSSWIIYSKHIAIGWI